MTVRAYLNRPKVQAFLQRPRVTPIVLFAGLGILVTFLRSLVLNPTETATLPLLDAGSVLLRLVVAVLWFAAVLWAIRPGERGRAEQALLILGTLAFSILAVWVDRPAAVLMVTPIVARYWLTLRQSLGLFTALFIGSLLIYTLIPPLPSLASPKEWFGLLGLVVVTLTQGGFTYAAFEFMLQNEEKQAALRRTYRELHAYRSLELQHAALEERAHLSRELHDSLGHQLTALRLEAQRVRKLQQRAGGADPQITVSLDNVMARSGEALEQLQEVVSTLKVPQLDGTLYQALRDLIQTWPVPVHLTLEGQEPALPSSHKLAMYRGLQEALTNAHKHAPDQPVAAQLSHDGRQLRLSIRNPLCPAHPGWTEHRRGGAGLAGLRSRLEALGGSLQVTQDEEVFEVCLTLPLPTRA
ncbi:sensor histidine kinase [Deinococcus radiopugnans]|uniref:histidine kinase n=1 Tax=Deinococcus radiopugnans ATCC 19172 TaxID=585398 RepID=A0A5C4Y436_9DEIO|nr:histidine kinase [Deinococcus radiopugnans]MBB6017167.1 signal transduction histidine kinase [Deinococcus radiopugnans ATCC 19172]TNM70612.1 hypothetical protein FHR04_11955 [Deinococcus radiopugnans ATCC 19172]